MPKQKNINTLKPHLRIKIITTTFLLFIGATAAIAQSGKIVGTISDSESGEALIGATVKVVGTNYAAGSDVSGTYTIPTLPAGTYILEFNYIGYAGKQITDVEVKDKDVTNLDVTLNPSDGTTLDQVVITRSFRKESLNALYVQQKNSALISDGISSEQIKRSPDKSTSEALRRVSGATVQDNKFVVVRGLSDRYNVAMMDGSVLPSTEANRRAFSFDIIPANLIDKITISKTATPDLPADFAGGAVQIETKDIPEKDFLSLGVSYGFNTASTFKDFLGTKKNSLNYLGFDDGSSQLAKNFYSRDQVSGGLTARENRLALKSFPNNYAIQNNTALPSQTYQFALGRVREFKNNQRFGALFSVNYRNSQQILSNVKRDWWEYDYNDNQYKFSSNLGALANFAYSFGKSKITWKNLYNRSYDNNYLARTGTNGSSSNENQFFAYDILQKSLFKTTLTGEHALGENNDKLTWNASWSNINNNQPNQAKINYQRSIGSDPSIPFLATSITGIGKENALMFSDLNENIFAGNVNYSKPLNFLNAASTLKVGIGSQYRKRDFDARFLGFVLQSSKIGVQEAQDIQALAPDQIFSPDLINQNYYKLEEILGDGDLHHANSLTNFGYAMLDQKFNDRFRVVYGLRVEDYNVQLDSYLTTDRKIERVVDNHKLDVLPSVNFTYSVNSTMNLRASYYRTLARPEFRELAPFSYYDFENLASIYGNANLKRSMIDNADIRFEVYPNAGEVLSVSAFYKHFTDAIEPKRYDVNSSPDVSYFNTPNANLYGVEVEARKSLNFIVDNSFFKNTIGYVNVALVHSEVENPTDQNYKEKTRPMVGQSPFVINGGLQHTAFDNKLSVNLLYNRIGKRIAQAGGIRFNSAYEAPRNVLDAQVGYKVLHSKGEIKLSASDILNNAVNVYFDNSADNKPNETLYRYKMGSNYSLSFNYTF